jgi:hypothetical protein
MAKEYQIFLDDKFIGTTVFEKSDAPMGVVVGLVKFIGIDNPYQFFHDYCEINHITLNEDDMEFGAIFTQNIEQFKILNSVGMEVKREDVVISGFKEEGYYIEVFGVPYPFYAEEFPHHVKAYNQHFD